MRAVLKTNDPVELNFAQALLKDVEIQTFVFDTESSIMDGSTGFVPRRLMVGDEDFSRAVAILREGLTGYLPP